MKAVICSELAGPDALTYEDIPDPVAGPGEIVVEVKAAGMNFPDVLITQGKYQFKPPLPFTPGGEVAGVVAQVGEGVTNVKKGDRVIAQALSGGFAEKLKVPAASAVIFPDSMPFEVAAGLTITYCTTIHAYRQRAHLQPGELVAVFGASGGVGLAAIELAKAMGAEVIACASSPEKLEVCKAAGADHLIDYGHEDLKERLKAISKGRGVDVVYDPVGGDFAEIGVRALAPNGRFLVVGFAGGTIPSIPINLCLIKQASIVGVFWGAWATANPQGQAENMRALFEMFEDGRIKPLVTEKFPLADFREGYARLTGRKAKGKVVLVP